MFDELFARGARDADGLGVLVEKGLDPALLQRPLATGEEIGAGVAPDPQVKLSILPVGSAEGQEPPGPARGEEPAARNSASQAPHHCARGRGLPLPVRRRSASLDVSHFDESSPGIDVKEDPPVADPAAKRGRLMVETDHVAEEWILLHLS